MTASPGAVRIADAGFEPADADSRLHLIARARRAFTSTNAAAPHWAWFVPGRIEIFGKHTDYAGGASLVAAVPRGFAIVAGPRTDRRVAVIDARWADRVTVDLGVPPRALRGWGNYVAVVAHRLSMNFPGASLGTDIAVASDLPRAAGLSSSSALVVGLALALARRGALVERPEWRRAIGSPLDLAGYLGAVENGLTFASLSSTSGVGTHGGSEDHTAILSSTAGQVTAFAYMPVRRLGEAVMPSPWRFVVMTSGVHADKAGSVLGRYNRASLATRALVSLWTSGGGTPGTLASILESGDDAEARLRAAIETAAMDDFSGVDLHARLSHFIGEHARVGRALEAFRHGASATLGELAAASQADAGGLLGNQVEETVALTAAARDAGGFAASSFGAGFGGSVWALIDRAGADAFAADWRARYQAACPRANPTECFVTRPGPAAVEVDLSE